VTLLLPAPVDLEAKPDDVVHVQCQSDRQRMCCGIDIADAGLEVPPSVPIDCVVCTDLGCSPLRCRGLR
jgi:hypothetical protein